MAEIIAHTHVGNLGQTATVFTLVGRGTEASGAWSLAEAYVDASRLVPARHVQAIREPQGALPLEVEPFRYLASEWKVVCEPSPDLSFQREDVTRVVTRTADAFAAGSHRGIPYRLYTPQTTAPRPLLLFLHGGGEGGSDNWLQLVGAFGPTAWVERYPQLMVLAPQDPTAWAAVRQVVQGQGTTARRLPGWSVETLDAVAEVIGELIERGEADAERVYVTGMSMGGAGSLRILAHHGSLFAAAAPVCPSMNEETLPYLKGLGRLPIWISSAYRDTFPTRHLQIVEGIEHLRAAGNQQARYTLYSAEELAAYGLGCNPSLTDEQRWSENHHSWVLTYHNAYGIMDWLLAQRRR